MVSVAGGGETARFDGDGASPPLPRATAEHQRTDQRNRPRRVRTNSALRCPIRASVGRPDDGRTPCACNLRQDLKRGNDHVGELLGGSPTAVRSRSSTSPGWRGQ
ncbi:MAG: hypothetical protein MZV64_19310 [Ignavibacteriales bacterium]|nr:hypothetical protein [Ignavibacteriales bacterium]